MWDLWAELNDEQTSPEVSVRAQKSGAMRRRLTEQAVFSTLRDWLLHDYVGAYCRVLAATRIYRRCYWIDALGGSSSPVLQSIASLTGVLARESRPIALRGIVLEAGSSKRKETRATGGENGLAKDADALPMESGIVNASWLEAAPLLLNAIDQSPAIFLLNPLGRTLFSYDSLALLYQRTAPTELFLFISHKQVATHLAAARGGTRDEAPGLTALLRSDRWKSLPAGEAEMEQAIEGIIDLLVASMQRHFLSVQRIALPVQVRPAVVETAPYTLIFATRRQDSLATMNDAACLYRRRLYEQSRRGVLVEAWFAAQELERHAEEMQQLYRRALQQGRIQRARRWPDLRQQLLNANFGRYTVCEYDEVIQRLLAEGAVRCEWRRKAVENEPGGEARRVPGNEDLLLWK